MLDREAMTCENRPGGGRSSRLTEDAFASRAREAAPSFRTKPWVRAVSAVMAVLLAVTMFDTTSLSPLMRDAQAAPATPSASLPMGERALFPSEDEGDGAAAGDAAADGSVESGEAGSAGESGAALGTGEPEGASSGTSGPEAHGDSSTPEGADEPESGQGADGDARTDAPAVSPWDAAWEAAADNLASLAPAGLTAARDVLPSLTEDFSDSDDIASRVDPALIAWGAPLVSAAGYQVKDHPLQVRYDLGNLGRTLAGGFIGGVSERDPFVLTMELPYLYQNGETLGTTYFEEEWRARAA